MTFRVWCLVDGREELCLTTYSQAVALVYYLMFEYVRGVPTYIQEM